jgi:hypothetical protein
MREIATKMYELANKVYDLAALPVSVTVVVSLFCGRRVWSQPVPLCGSAVGSLRHPALGRALGGAALSVGPRTAWLRPT